MKRTGFIFTILILLSLSTFAQRSNQKWYNHAVGLRLEIGGAGSSKELYGITYEHFLTKMSSVEILGMTDLNLGGELTGMYKFVNALPDVPATLRWYAGIGAHAGYWGIGYETYTVAGYDFMLGIGYSLKQSPINLTFDWHPMGNFVYKLSTEQFIANKFGFSARYIIE